MHRVDNSTAVPSLPTPDAVGVNPDSYFTNGDPSTATPATVLDDDFFKCSTRRNSYAYC
jgi:hypothetical protein